MPEVKNSDSAQAVNISPLSHFSPVFFIFYPPPPSFHLPDAVLSCIFQTEVDQEPRIEWKKTGKDVSFVYFKDHFKGWANGNRWDFSLRWPRSGDLIEEMVNKSSSAFHPDADSLRICMYLFINFHHCLQIGPSASTGVRRPWPQGIVNTNPILRVHTNAQTKALAEIFDGPN